MHCMGLMGKVLSTDTHRDVQGKCCKQLRAELGFSGACLRCFHIESRASPFWYLGWLPVSLSLFFRASQRNCSVVSIVLSFPTILSRDCKNHDSQRHDRILGCSLHPEIRQLFLVFWGNFLTNYAVSLEKREKNPLEKIQKIQWRRRPEIADFCPLSRSNSS